MTESATKRAWQILICCCTIPVVLWTGFILLFIMYRGFGWPFECGEYDEYPNPSWMKPWYGDLEIVAVVADLHVAILLVGAQIAAIVSLVKRPRLGPPNLYLFCCAAAFIFGLWVFEQSIDNDRFYNSRSHAPATVACERWGMHPTSLIERSEEFMLIGLPVLSGVVCASCVVGNLARTTLMWIVVGVGRCFPSVGDLRARLGLHERLQVTLTKLALIVLLPLCAIYAAYAEWSHKTEWPPRICRFVNEVQRGVIYQIKDYRTTEAYSIDPVKRTPTRVTIWFRESISDESDPRRVYCFTRPEEIASLQTELTNPQAEPAERSDNKVQPLTPKMFTAAARLEKLFSASSLQKQQRKTEDPLTENFHWTSIYPETYQELEPYHAMEPSFYREHR